MKFSEIVKQAVALLHDSGRITYRALQREFALDDTALNDLKEELLFSHPEIADVEGRGLVWNGPELLASAPASDLSPQPRLRNAHLPVSYTPPHLADRILAEQAAREARGAIDRARKTITALCADLKVCTALNA